MKRRILQPEQIIVPYEYKLGSENTLKIYFRTCDKGHSRDLPPVLVARPKFSDRDFLLDHFVDKEGFRDYFRRIDEMGEVFYLIDGNHRGVAETLCYNPINALELQNDDDLEQLEKMVQSGEYFNLPNFPFEYHDLGWVDGKLKSAVTYLEEEQKSRKILTLRQRVNKLTSNGDLPEYMKERYHRGK